MDTPNPKPKASLGIVGAGAAACVACCAGPVLGALSAIGIASAAGYLLAGTAALAVGVVAAVFVTVRRHRRANACAAAATTTILAAPTIKPTATPSRTGDGRDTADLAGHGSSPADLAP